MSQPAPVAATSDPASAGPVIETRYGLLPLDPERQVDLNPGLVGFAGATRFQLADVPERDVPFKLLQSVEIGDLGVLVLPLDAANGPIARAELENACRTRGFAFEHVVVLGVVTLRAEPGTLHCTVNLRAPILIDSERRAGCQHVLQDESYDLRHPLLLDAAPAGTADAG